MVNENINMAADAAQSESEETEAFHVTDKRRIRINEDGVVAAVEEPEDPPVAEAVSEVEELSRKLREAEAKRDEAERQVRDFSERFRHAQTQLRAENEEVRARLQRNFDQKLETARGDIVAQLLDVLDNLSLAVGAAEGVQNRTTEFNAMLDGVRATAQLFASRLGAMGLSPVPAAGEIFNPEIHEAVEMVPCESGQDGRVVGEMQTGYRFADRLLRPARVRVGRAS
ncbi:MAG: nucleotide exchange factor GrpE [Blastocatellia bacterium]